MNALLRKIEIFRGINSSMVAEPEAIEVEALPSDYFDFQRLSKQEVAKMSVETLESLVQYGENYLEDFASGKFLYKNKSRVFPWADFEEAGVKGQIEKNLLLLKKELCKRG